MRFFVRSGEGERAERLRLRDAIFAAVKAARHGGIALVGEGAADAEDAAVIARYRRWQRKYGAEEVSSVPADDVYRLLEEVARPSELGLELIRRGLFGRQIDLDIIQLFRFGPAKGYSYYFQWGVSLAFVPHEFERRIRFHRTLKSAEQDLFENAPEEFERRGGDESDGFVAALYGADILRRDATHAWTFVRPRVAEWYASTSTVEGVLARARDQARLISTQSHWPEPALVVAFALARLGYDEEARKALDEWLANRARESWAPTAAKNLLKALGKVRP